MTKPIVAFRSFAHTPTKKNVELHSVCSAHVFLMPSVRFFLSNQSVVTYYVNMCVCVCVCVRVKEHNHGSFITCIIHLPICEGLY
jgi:hypothetical protein